MTATMHTLVTDQDTLYRAWVAACARRAAGPDIATENAVLRSFKPYYVRFIGAGWEETYAEHYRDEVAWCRLVAIRAKWNAAKQGVDRHG